MSHPPTARARLAALQWTSHPENFIQCRLGHADSNDQS
jgi:hypothetical protein